MPYDTQPVQYDKSYLPLAQTAANVSLGQQFQAQQGQMAQAGPGFNGGIGSQGAPMSAMIGQALTAGAGQNNALALQVAQGNFQGRLQNERMTFNADEAARGRALDTQLTGMSLGQRQMEIERMRSLAARMKQNRIIAAALSFGGTMAGSGWQAWKGGNKSKPEEGDPQARPSSAQTFSNGQPDYAPGQSAGQPDYSVGGDPQSLAW